MSSARIFLPLTLLLAPLAYGASSPWTVYETARDNGHRLTMIAAAGPGPAGAATLTLDPTRRYQEMVGFGGALTESSAWVLAQLPAAGRREVIRRYYDPQVGIGYTLGRTHLNSCDFSLNMWTLDDTPGDFDLRHFSLEPMRPWLLPLLHEVQETAGPGRLHLLVSPWSPPAWMKTNNRMDDGGALRPEYRAAWADFYVRFIRAMRDEEGIPIWAFTVQNEPEARQTWESCLYTPDEERDFVRDYLGPALANAGLSGVKLLGWDHNRDGIEARAAAMLGDPKAARYLWGMGVHWYVSDDFDATARVHQRFPDKPILFTEGCCEGGDTLGAWDHGEHYAAQMISSFDAWVCGFLDWNIVLDQRGGPNHVGNFCDAPVIVDTRTGEIRYSAAFYYIGQFSRFVHPGAHRIASAGGPGGLQSIGFANPDGSLVCVVLNATDHEASFRISVDHDTLDCRLPAHAIQTYVRAAR
ncbi:MAG TPA: glycoside hydrolase family 30 protein [Opitutaceae bacterium]|nr:glycoside hydrolase family 30 protein [Opitutaceae bacterium]